MMNVTLMIDSAKVCNVSKQITRNNQSNKQTLVAHHNEPAYSCGE